MKRFHMHVGVKSIEESVLFYSTLFGQQPTKLRPDYAKWMLEDPRINFAISTRSNVEGVDHIGIQVENHEELTEIKERLKRADLKIFAEGETTCCYSESDRAWVKDPSGLAWEAYQNMADADVFSEKQNELTVDSACCVPSTETKKSCC